MSFIKLFRRKLHTLRYALAILLAVTATLSSCRHKDLLFDEIPELKIEVRFDWRHDPEANPEGMRIFFYPVEANQPSYQKPAGEMKIIDIPGTKGGTVTLRPGTYRIIAYNNDSEVVRFGNNTDLYTHHATTGTCNITDFLNGQQQPPALTPSLKTIENTTRAIPSSINDEECRLPMNKLWAAVSDIVTVAHSTADTADAGAAAITAGTRSTTLITLYPKPIHCVYYCEVRNVENIEYVSQVSGAITGLSPAHHFEKNMVDEKCVTIPFAASANIQKKTISGIFLTFGHHSSNSAPHRLLIYLRMADGSNYRFGAEGERFDVSQQIDAASDPRHVYILVDGLDIPVSFPDGFVPAPDDWSDVYTDVPV